MSAIDPSGELIAPAGLSGHGQISQPQAIDRLQVGAAGSKGHGVLKFCEKLTTNPGDMRRADIEKLRELG
jgi:hypothetical protein